MKRKVAAVFFVILGIVIVFWATSFYHNNRADLPEPQTKAASFPAAAVDQGTLAKVGAARDVADRGSIEHHPLVSGLVGASNETSRKALFLRQTERKYGPLIDELPIAEEKKGALRKLLLERELEEQDARAAAVSQHLSHEELELAVTQATADSNAAIAALLGPEVSNQWNAVQEVAETYEFVTGSVGLDMSFAGVPLTVSQGLQLAKAMKAANYGPSAGVAPMLSMMGMTPQTDSGFNQVLAQASSFLTPQQIDVLKQSDVERQLQLQEIAKVAQRIGGN